MPKDMAGEAILSRLDAAKGVDVDQIVEIIMNSNGHTLARFAKAVAMAFERKAK